MSTIETTLQATRPGDTDLPGATAPAATAAGERAIRASEAGGPEDVIERAEPEAFAVRYDLRKLRSELLLILDGFCEAVHSSKVSEDLGKDMLAHLHDRREAILSRLESPFTLVVVGDFKRGKSTLINALLEAPVVTTNVTPETVTINEIEYGPALAVEACLQDGGHISLRTEDMPADRLVPILERMPRPVANLALRAPVEWLRGMRLVDTPGTGDIFNRFDNQVHDYLAKADAVLCVVSAISPLSESEQAFLRVAVVPQDFPKLFFVINMLDFARTEEEAERLMRAMRTRIHQIFPHSSVFGVSALDEYCRVQGLPRPNVARAAALEAEFQALRSALAESILVNRDLIQMDRASLQVEQMLQECEASMVLLQKALQADQARLSQVIRQYEDAHSDLHAGIEKRKQTVDANIKRLAEQAVVWMEEFLDRFQRDSVPKIRDYKLEAIRKHYKFFLNDLLRTAMSACFLAHQAQILESASRAHEGISRDCQTANSIGGISAQVAEAASATRSWTRLETLEVMVDVYELDLGFKFLARLFMRGANETEVAQQTLAYQESLTRALPELKRAIGEEIRALYDRAALELRKTIDAAFQREVDASLAALRQAQKVHAQGEQRVHVVNEGAIEVLLAITEARAGLALLRTKLPDAELAA